MELLTKFIHHKKYINFQIAFIVSILIFAFAKVQANADDKKVLPFIAILTSGQGDSNIESDAFGVAFMTFDQDESMLCYSISFTEDKLLGTETAAHFHGPASPGESADVLFGITPDVSPIGSPKEGCVGPLSKKEFKQLKKGRFYLNIHTTEVPGGEIRGQVLPIRGTSFKDIDEDEDENEDEDED